MTDYTAKLTPNEVNMGTEGGLDILVDGVSIQRTLNGIMLVDNTGGRKIVGKLKDGDSFDDIVDVAMPISVPITLSPGQQVQVSSIDERIKLIFDSVTTSGKLTINPIEDPRVTNTLFYEIYNTAEIGGSTTISFNNKNIKPDNYPVIYHIRYDVWLDEIFYEDITTETIEGKIIGVVNPVAAGFNAQIFGSCSGQCTYSFDRTEGIWVFSNNYCSGTNMFGQPNPNCSCPSAFYVNSYEDDKNGCRDAGPGGCVVNCGFPEDHKDPNMRDIFAIWIEPNLDTRFFPTVMDQRERSRGILKNLRSRGWIPEEIEKPTQAENPCPGLQTRPGLGIVATELEVTLGLAGPCGCWETPVTQQIIDGIFDLFSSAGTARATGAQLIKTINTTDDSRQREYAKKQLPSSIAQYVSNIADAYQLLPSLTLGDTSAFAAQTVYSEKDCNNPKNQDNRNMVNPVLRPGSCSCCPACTNGKEFANDSTCYCHCPPDKEPCTSQIWGDGCYIPCTGGKIRNTSTCVCQCPQDPCPAGQTRDPFDCVCHGGVNGGFGQLDGRPDGTPYWRWLYGNNCPHETYQAPSCLNPSYYPNPNWTRYWVPCGDDGVMYPAGGDSGYIIDWNTPVNFPVC
jgi:hypothetical protein